MWRQFLGEMNATESRVFIVVERTEDLVPEVLRALDALTAADTNGCAGANVVLLGNEGLDEHLTPPLLDSLRQRIRLRQRLVPFTVAELEEYLRYHVARAGGEFDRIFAPDAIATLHRYTAGNARLSNNLCETALTLAASEGQAQLTAELITTTAVGWFGFAGTAQHEPAKPETAAPPAPNGAKADTVPVPATATPTAAPTPTAPQVSRPTPVATTAITATATAQPTEVAPTAAAAATSPAPPSVVARTSESARDNDVTATDYDFDGGATDIPEVAMTDFPVLTDAVDEMSNAVAVPHPVAAPAARVETPPPLAAAPPRVTLPAPTFAPSPPPATPPPAPTLRVDTAYAPKRPAPATAPAPKPAVAAPPSVNPPPPPFDEGDADELRKTQTMRAISVATSIDDISNSMAETLFGEADLDMLSAALASAGWSDEETATATPPEQESPPASASASASAPAPAPVDDPFDLFDLGPDAPLELIDDSMTPQDEQRRKIAWQR
jgi:hypothetical protein